MIPRIYIQAGRPVSLWLFAGIMLAVSQTATAAPTNGTRFPAARCVELGYEYDAVFARTLDRSTGDLRNANHFCTVSYGVSDWFSLDGKAGIGDVSLDNSSYLPGLDLKTGFSGGYGFRMKVFEHRQARLRLIVGGQHISVHPKQRTVDSDRYESFLDDWQVSALAAKDLPGCTVYAGAKASDCEFVYKLNGHDKKRRYSEDHIGLVVGAEIFPLNDGLRISVEGRFFDENAVSAAVSYLFR